MPMPREYQLACSEFDRMLTVARDSAGLATRNQTWTMVQAVFQVFRRRLSTADAIRFSQALPPLACALFVADWDPEEEVLAFADRETMTREVQALRQHHNFAPESCIADVAAAVHACVDAAAFERTLDALPGEVRAFWAVAP